MRSSTGAAVLVVTALVLLFAWPQVGAAPGSVLGAPTGGAAAGAGAVPTRAAGAPTGSATTTENAGTTGTAPVATPTIAGTEAPSLTAPEIPAGSDAAAPPVPRAPANTVLVLGSVFFPSNATELGPDATRMLAGIATTYKGTTQQLEIVGHADARGDAQANLRLSAQRAEAVRSYLTANGIPAANMTVSYDGARTPMARGVDPEANAQNRRVEVRIP